LACLSVLLFPNSYVILFLEFYFLPFSVHVRTNVIYVVMECKIWNVTGISKLVSCCIFYILKLSVECRLLLLCHSVFEITVPVCCTKACYLHYVLTYNLYSECSSVKIWPQHLPTHLQIFYGFPQFLQENSRIVA
jgi:hypothetical protein